MPPTAPPPAAAPAAAPAKPQSSAPAPGAAPLSPTPPAQVKPPPSAKPSAKESVWDEIDRLDREEPKPTAKKEAKQTPPAEKSVPSAEKPSETQNGASGKDTESSTSDASGDTSSPAEKPPIKINELRTAYENLKKEHSRLKEEYSKAKAAPVEDPEKPKLLESLESAKKRVQALEEELKYSAYERSDEYQNTYQKPFEDAYQNGRHLAASLEITTEEGTTRPGTQADFDSIMAIADHKKAVQRISELFGPGAAAIIYERQRVLELARLRDNAVEDYRKNGAAREQERQEKLTATREQQKRQMAKMDEDFKRFNQEAIEKRPQYFKADEGDEKGAEILKKGFETADKAFSRDTKLPPEELVALHSAIRNKAAGFDYLVYKNKQAKAKIAELEAKLEEFKESVPGADGGKHLKGKAPLSFNEEIDMIDKQS